MTPAEACAHVARRLGRHAISATPLTGGLLNHVFRVALEGGGTVIVKHAPPYVAAAPEIELDPGRSTVEATVLGFVQGQPVPALLDADPPVLILEDLGELPDLAAYLSRGGDVEILERLAHWLRQLHEGPRPALDNRSVQETRMAVQYAPAEQWLAARGVPDAAQLGAKLRQLGARFIQGGSHLVMGDLWPASVLVKDSGQFVVMDWELATCGHRAQDLGHLAAHLDLEAAAGALPWGLAERFLQAYGAVTSQERRDTAHHRGAELLARSIGGFPRPDLDAAARAHVVEHALAILRASGASL